MHKVVEPSILYFGTPVVLIGSINEDGTYNLTPMSSVFWLGWRGVLGVATTSKTAENLIRTRECTLNLPSASLVSHVDRLALTTGSNPVPALKRERGYGYVADKFARAGLTPIASQTISAPRVLECPIQLETVVEAVHPVAADDDGLRGNIAAFEVRVQRVHADEALLVDGVSDRIDPDRWRPLIMSFQNFYGLGSRLHPSRLATIPESAYRTADIKLTGGIASSPASDRQSMPA